MMPRTTSPRTATLLRPHVVLRSGRRATLAGPSQLLSRKSLSPVVMIEGNVLEKIKKGSMNAAKSQPKSGKKAAGSKHTKAAQDVKSSPKPKTDRSPHKDLSSAVKKSPPKTGNKAGAKKTGNKRRSKATKSVELSPKPKKAAVRRSRHIAAAKTPTKQSSPKKQKSPSPRLKEESPSHSYVLRSMPSPVLLHLDDDSKVQSTRKTVKAARKRDRSVSPASKKPKVVSEKRKKSPAARSPDKKTPLKVAGKRKREPSEEKDEDKLSPPEKKQQLKSGNRSAVNKTSKKVSDTSFTEVKSKMVAANSVKAVGKLVPVSEQNSTPLKPRLSENVSMNWSMSSIRKKLLAGLTPFRLKEAYKSPASTSTPTSTRKLKSALFSPKKTDTTDKQRTARRQSVRFMINGKADTVKELKQRSSRKRFFYRLCQYLLLLGLPAAAAVGAVLAYNGLV